MKYTTITTLAALLLGSASASAQEAFTNPSGYVTVEVTPASSVGSTATTAFSVSLRKSKKLSGVATDVTGAVVTMSGQTWTPTTEWATSSIPHLLYITNANGVQSFLITANTADTLTVAVPSGYTLETDFADDAAVFIIEASTIGNLFETASADVDFVQNSLEALADNLYLWNGTGWTPYWYSSSLETWTSNGFTSSNNDVVFPDDGIFVIRRSTDALSLVFTGSVPTQNQLTRIPAGSSFIGSKYPVDAKLKDMGLLNLPGWNSDALETNADTLYLWNSAASAWVTFWHSDTLGFWTSNGFTSADDDVIPGNSALFVLKNSSGNGSAGSTLPYDLSASE